MVEDETNKQTTAPEGETKEENPMIVEARALAESILEGNNKFEANLHKQETLLAEMALAGQLGGRVENKPKVETNDEYAARIEKEIAEGKYNDN